MNRPTLEEKKRFLTWFIKHYQLKRRESLWILNYLLNHELLLKNIHFVENIAHTHRGMAIATLGSDEDSFAYYKSGHRFEEPEQAFHDLRLNWKEDFYLELFFDQAYVTLSAFGVLEENPFIESKDTVDPAFEREVSEALDRIAMLSHKEYLLQLIDQALLEQDREKFESYSNQLRALEEEKI